MDMQQLRLPAALPSVALALSLSIGSACTDSSREQAQPTVAPKPARAPAAPVVPEATVSLADGTTLQLLRPALYSDRYGSGVSYLNPPAPQQTPVGILLARDIMWTRVRLSDIARLNLRPNPEHDKYGELLRWLKAEMKLASGETLSGRIPGKPDLTWMCGGDFLVRGDAVVSGNKAEFSMDIDTVRSIIRVAERPDAFDVKDDNGKTYRVANAEIFLRTYYGDRMDRYDYDQGDIRVETGAALTTTFKMRDIENVVFGKIFPGYTPGWGIDCKIRTKKGEEIEGRTLGFRSVFGETRSGQIVFAPLDRVRSIRFK